ncbi:MAG: TSUP family transporter [Dehalococcoidia bacterium]
MVDIIIAIVFGFVGGFAGGLLGIGGGAIYVPGMVLLLDEPQHIAQGASLAAIIAAGIVGGLTHLKRGNVDVGVVVQVAPVAAVAAFGAAFLADALPAEALRRIFGVVILYFAITMIIGALGKEQAPVEGGDSRHG